MVEMLQELLEGWGLLSQGLHLLSPILLIFLGLFLILNKKALPGDNEGSSAKAPEASLDKGLARPSCSFLRAPAISQENLPEIVALLGAGRDRCRHSRLSRSQSRSCSQAQRAGPGQGARGGTLP